MCASRTLSEYTTSVFRCVTLRGMAPESADPGFRITDRRRHADEDQPRAEPPATPLAPPPAPARLDAEPLGDLAGLFLMFASSAMIALGESPDPVTGRERRDLAEAREAIDILRLLRAKTEGNRTPDEDRLLQQIIYDLQLRFVRATTPGSGRSDDRPRP